jgi:hypothetical protein
VSSLFRRGAAGRTAARARPRPPRPCGGPVRPGRAAYGRSHPRPAEGGPVRPGRAAYGRSHPRPADHPPAHHQATQPTRSLPKSARPRMPPATSLAPCCCYRDIVLPRHRWHPAAATATSLALCCRSRARAAPLTPPIPPTSAIQPKIRANAPVFIFGVGSPLIARVIYPDHGTRPVFMIPVPGVRFFGLRDRDHETRPAGRGRGWLQEAAHPTPDPHRPLPVLRRAIGAPFIKHL